VVVFGHGATELEFGGVLHRVAPEASMLQLLDPAFVSVAQRQSGGAGQGQGQGQGEPGLSHTCSHASKAEQSTDSSAAAGATGTATGKIARLLQEMRNKY
jgi:hypothetical protein